jgi:hypothetical protein
MLIREGMNREFLDLPREETETGDGTPRSQIEFFEFEGHEGEDSGN